MLATIGLLLGLVLFGREHYRLLLLAAIWIALVTVPVLGMPPRNEDLEGNRYLYLMSAGYMICVSVLLCSAIVSASHRRLPLISVVSLSVLISIFACWFQLGTWQTASSQVNDVVNGLLRWIPPQPRPSGMVWFAENVPSRYKGVPVLLSGLGISRLFADGNIDYPHIEIVPDATKAPINRGSSDAFALRFAYNPWRDRFDIDYIAGITSDGVPPSPQESGDNLQLWDFRACGSKVLESWRGARTQPACEPNVGLIVQQTDKDPQLIGPEVSFNPGSSGAEYVRLRVAMSYPPNSGDKELVNEWFWHGSSDDWSQEHSKALPLKQDGNVHVYWTFLRADEAGQGISGFRFDPINDDVSATIEWIAIDLVK